MKLLNSTIITFFLALMFFCSFFLVRELGPLIGLILLKFLVYKADAEAKPLLSIVIDIIFWLMLVVFAICDIFLNAMLYLWTTKF